MFFLRKYNMDSKQKAVIELKIEIGNKYDLLFSFDGNSEKYKSLKKEIKEDEEKLRKLSQEATEEWLYEQK